MKEDLEKDWIDKGGMAIVFLVGFVVFFIIAILWLTYKDLKVWGVL